MISFHAIIAVGAVTLASLTTVSSADELPLEVGAFGGFHVFSDTNELGAFDENSPATLGNGPILGARVSYFVIPKLAVEGELGLLPTETDGVATDVTAIVYRASGLYHLYDVDHNTRPFALAGVGAMTGRPDDQNVNRDDTDLVLHAGIGVKHHIAAGWGLRADARILFPPSTGSEFVTTDFEGIIGFYKAFDQPVKVAPPPDTDGDGFIDPEDGCPTEAEDKDGFEDQDGCPDPDNDKDLIMDKSDGCPLIPEDKDGFEDTDGCPEEDNDKDGLLDGVDECPDDPEDMDQFEDENGCPDPDNDGDGILDVDDKCINEPETKNGYEDSDGCPDEVPVAVKKFTGTIKGIRFKSNSDQILSSSSPVLDAAAAVLEEYPTVKLEIQGHTDDVGKDDYNLDLSDRRAASVRTYLLGKGIAEDRLVARGYGETQPEVENDTKANKAQNRRVVFVLIP